MKQSVLYFLRILLSQHKNSLIDLCQVFYKRIYDFYFRNKDRHLRNMIMILLYV